MRRLVIIGGGPRGLFALENLYLELVSLGFTVKTTLFEEEGLFGCSHVYDVDQPDTNWINITERLLDLPERPEIVLNQTIVPKFPSYHEWRGIDIKSNDSIPDTYPPRALVGQYLKHRFKSIADVLVEAGLLNCIKEKIIDIDYSNDILKVRSSNGKEYLAEEVLITIGHQKTKADEQLIRWEMHSASNPQIHLFKTPYPINRLYEHKEIFRNRTVALRGFGLAMIDVIRALTIGLGGKFQIKDNEWKQMEYVPNKNTPKKFIPFSLDGLPQSPKPLNKSIDLIFRPQDWEFQFIKRVVGVSLRQSHEINNLDFIIEPISYIVANVFKRSRSSSEAINLADHDLQSLIKAWIYTGNVEHELFVSKKQKPDKSLEQLLRMACGLIDCSLDYCIGQVWRHLQSTMYELFAYPRFNSSLINDLVNIDERLKRFSYGPPVESLQQILALMRAGFIKVEAIDDPDIILKPCGWSFEPNDEDTLANIMIDTVLDSTTVNIVDAPIIQSLLNKGLIVPIHKNLGVKIEKDGRVVTESGKPIPLAFIGRLAKGSLLGVDAILECFGEPVKFWAKGVVDRFNKK